MNIRRIPPAGSLLAALTILGLAAGLGACSDEDSPLAPAPDVTVRIDVTPDSSVFAWTLEGPDYRYFTGAGDTVLTGLGAGVYEMTWQPAHRFDAPEPGTQKRSAAAGDTLVFAGTYAPDDFEILFLGSSYFGYNDLPGMFRKFVAENGLTAHVEAHAPGGWYLDDHVISETSQALIASRKWDYVVLQGVGSITAYPASAHFNLRAALQSLEQAIHANRDETVMMFCLPFAFEDGMTWVPGMTDDYFDMQQLAYDHTLAHARAVDMAIAPVGWAYRSIMAMPWIPLHYLYLEDFNHPSVRGSFLMCSTIYTSIYREAPAKTPFFYRVTEDEAVLFRDTAATVVLDTLSLWGLE